MKKFLWKLSRFFDPSQPVLYDSRTHKFLHVKFAQDNGIICGDFCEYYNDSQTNIQRQLLSYDYIFQCEKVGAVDKFPHAKLCKIVKSWKVN